MGTNGSIDEDLRRMLAGVGKDPAVPADLTATVKREVRRRRGRRLGALTGVLVLAVSVGVGVAVHQVGRPASDRSAVHRQVPATLEPGREDRDWAAKAIRMPAELPGRPYYLVGMLDRRHVLVATLSGFERVSTLTSYDTVTHETTVLTDMAVTGGLVDPFPQRFYLDDKKIVWWVNAKTPGGREMVQFWAFDRTAGAKHVVATLPNTYVGNISVLGDQLFYSDRTAIYRLPLAGGGTPVQVEGSEHLSIIQDEWASTPATGWPADFRSGTNHRARVTLVNLRTGQRRPVEGPVGSTAISCGPTWCAGQLVQDQEIVTFGMRVDGSHVTVYPPAIGGPDWPLRGAPIGGHYLPFHYGRGDPSGRYLGLLDLATGESGELGVWLIDDNASSPPHGPNSAGTPSMVDPHEKSATSRATPVGPTIAEMPVVAANPAIIGWPTTSGDEIYVLPLT